MSFIQLKKASQSKVSLAVRMYMVHVLLGDLLEYKFLTWSPDNMDNNIQIENGQFYHFKILRTLD